MAVGCNACQHCGLAGGCGSCFGFATLRFVTPGILLPLLGIALSVTGFRLTKAVVSRTSLRVAYVINGFASAFHPLITLGLAVLWLFSVGLLKLSDMH